MCFTFSSSLLPFGIILRIFLQVNESVLKKAEEFLKGKGLYELFQNFVLGIGINKNRNKDGLE